MRPKKANAENGGQNGGRVGEKAAQAPDRDYGWVAAIILAAIIVIGLSYGYNTVTERNRMKKLCNDYSLSPDLRYPTACVPLSADSSGGDYVDTRSDPLCRCTVDLGNGTSTVIDVRVSK